MFYGKEFIWNSVPSKLYNVFIYNFSTDNVITSPTGGDINIISDKIYREPRPYVYGVTAAEPMEFDFTVGCERSLSGLERNMIEKWLIGKQEYGTLQIIQCDIYGIYYKIFLTKSTINYIGNLSYGLNLHAICDAPWAWEYPKNFVKTYTGNNIISESFVFNNMSADADYEKPIIAFTTNSIGNAFTITNTTDDSRQFIFTGISPLETITVNNRLQTIVSSLSLARASTFNKKFFRLVPGLNSINIAGGISNFTMTTQNAMKIGG